MVGSHDPFLVVLSVLIAIAASYTALDLAGRVAASEGQARAWWLVAGSIAMGIGIWSMHFVGMLAFSLPVPIGYDVPRVLASAGVAILASAFALFVAARPVMSVSTTVVAGLWMGLAIAGMHYIGMSALRADVQISYRGVRVVVSVVVAITASCVALWLAHRYRMPVSRREEGGKILSAILMGGAIVGMHFIAMSAVMYAEATTPSLEDSNHILVGTGLTATVALGTLLLLSVALIAAAVHRRVSLRLLAATQASRSALQAQEQFLRQVIDANPSLIFVKNRAGQFTLANRAMASMYATTPEELIGKTDLDFSVSPEEVEKYLRDDRDVIDTHQTRFISEEPFTNPESRSISWFQTVKVPLTVGNGEAFVLGVATDITERKLLADQLRQAQKMEAIGQLTGGIAHDLNNILTVILANADLIANSFPEALHESRRDFLDLQSAAGRGADMVRKLLAFSRREMITLRPVALERLCLEIEGTLRRLIPATIEVTLSADKDVPGISADAGAIEQMLLNLATNARDAMPDGGKLLIDVSRVELDAEWCATHGWGRPGQYVCLSVTDSGVGIEPGIRERIFEPFFTTKPQGAGTGLGLSMVYGLMRQHDGYVEVYSELHHGTSVNLYFPAQTPVAADGAPFPGADVRGGTETILIADDEEAIRRSLSRVLERHGYSVYTVGDGVEALAVMQTHASEIALIISDVVMPRMGGRELYQQLREANVQVPFLFTSGYAAREVWEAVALRSDVPFLHKPWAMSDLLIKVRAVIDDAASPR